MKRRRRRGDAPLWMKLAALAAALALAVLVIVLLARLITGALNLARGGDGERDPQFAEPAEVVTRPPELDSEGNYMPAGEDPSANWEQGEETPVDKTAEELILEAEAAQ